ncbi:MAG: hypothetical protein EP332_05150 [Bacteroidetes bacterium]|nr:MAG: hypothetical protein EP332_05150 [Bacteroidota bacterium]
MNASKYTSRKSNRNIKVLIVLGLFITFACSVLLEKTLMSDHMKAISSEPQVEDLQVNLK